MKPGYGLIESMLADGGRAPLLYRHLERLQASARELGVPLNDDAMTVLQGIPRKNDTPYVIAGNMPCSHIVNLRKPWLRVLKEAEIENVRLHDLRHSFASAAASAGIPIQIVGALLGHSSLQSTARYAHLYDEPLREASGNASKVIRAKVRY